MKITTEPVKRVSLIIYDKGKIVLQAYSIDRNVKPTAREFNVQPKQIRKWKKEGFHDDCSSSLVPIVAVHEQTDAVRANSMEYTYLDVEDEPLVRQALRRQIELRKRKRLSSAHRKEGGGRKPSFSEETIQELLEFFIEMREDELPVTVEELICQVKLIDPAACEGVSHTALRHRMYRLLDSKMCSSYRKGTHKAQDTMLLGDRMREFNKYIRLKAKLLGVPSEAIFNFDETNVYFSPSIASTYTIKGLKTVGIKEKKSLQRCTAMLGGSMAGEKAEPFVIFTGANTRNGVVKQQIANPERFGYSTEIEYGVQQKGWMDTNGILDWIAKVWSPIANGHETTILILDFLLPI